MRSGNLLLLGTKHDQKLAPTRRSGIVRAVGPEWVDDTGAYYPLGGTLFWALRGFKYEPSRIRQNQKFLADNGCDFQRILGYVDWKGNDIDWHWALTEECFGRFLDYSWGDYGLRTSLSMLGSHVEDKDASEIATRVGSIIASRLHTILDIDCANEANQNQISLYTTELMAQVLRSRGYRGILALTDAEHSGLTWDAIKAGGLLVSGANSLMSHPDRDLREDGCRMMRQPYDYKGMPQTVHMEEPIGPRSSVAECVDPLQLAILRACGIMHGEGAFVIHNGAGVAGKVDEQHNRPANLWEVPNIVNIMAAIKNVDKIMPRNAGTGRHFNNETNNPFRVTTIWPEDGHGANRRYTTEYTGGFISTTFGVVSPATYVCYKACHVEAFDPVLGINVQESDVPAGGSITLYPRTVDYAGHGGFIVRGTFR